jgi:nicotinic acid mononucleotide adenylyltransferase
MSRTNPSSHQRPDQSEQPTPLDFLATQMEQAPPPPGRRRAVLLSTGSMCPVHIGHLTLFDIAGLYLSHYQNIDVLCGFLSPSSDTWVEHKLGPRAIPFDHRRKMCELSVEEHNRLPGVVHVVVDPWEGLQNPVFVSMLTVRYRLECLVHEIFGDPNLLVLFLAGLDLFTRAHLDHAANVIAVGRPPFSSSAKANPSQNVFVCGESQEEFAHLFSDKSSSEIRKRLDEQRSLEGLTYPSVVNYVTRLHDHPEDFD